jgi:hypothetical protein
MSSTIGGPDDGRCALQAWRHLWVMAVERRLVRGVVVGSNGHASGTGARVEIEVRWREDGPADADDPSAAYANRAAEASADAGDCAMATTAAATAGAGGGRWRIFRGTTPCLVPEFARIASVRVTGAGGFWPVNVESVSALRHSRVIHVQRREATVATGDNAAAMFLGPNDPRRRHALECAAAGKLGVLPLYLALERDGGGWNGWMWTVVRAYVDSGVARVIRNGRRGRALNVFAAGHAAGNNNNDGSERHPGHRGAAPPLPVDVDDSGELLRPAFVAELRERISATVGRRDVLAAFGTYIESGVWPADPALASALARTMSVHGIPCGHRAAMALVSAVADALAQIPDPDIVRGAELAISWMPHAAPETLAFVARAAIARLASTEGLATPRVRI